MSAAVPGQEAERLETLRRYRILDTPPEGAFDDLVLLASQVCDTPIAMMSLIDADRQWIKAKVGFAVAKMKAYEEIAALKAQLDLENLYLRRELIDNVCHDLRTPLAALRGYLETLMVKEDTLLPERRRAYLEIAMRQGEHLGTLVSELFELAKLDFKGYRINPEPVQLGELVPDVVRKFELTAEQKRLALTCKLRPELPIVRADIALNRARAR